MLRHRRLAPLAALVLAGCSSTSPPPAPVDAREAAFQAENARAMDVMMAGMHAQATGDVDRDFALMMIPHHQGAVDMARALLRHGRNEKLKALARSIVATQTREIAIMREAIGGPLPLDAAGTGMPHGHHAM